MLTTLFSMSLLCTNCKHFIADKQECTKFENINLVTGEKTYDSARFARKYSELCGEKGLLFEKNELKIFTEPYYFVKGNWLSVILICMILSKIIQH